MIEATGNGDVEKQLRAMTTILVNIVAERFGVKEVKSAEKHYSKNALKKQYKKAGACTFGKASDHAQEEASNPTES